MVEEIVASKGMYCNARDAYEYWDKKNWFTKKQQIVKSLEIAIDVYNGIVLEKDVNKKVRELGLWKQGKKARKATFNFVRTELLASKREPNRVSLLKEKPRKSTKIVKKEKKTPEQKQIYSEQLKDNRWYSFRRFVFDVRGKKCEKCGATSELQVHHPKYFGGRKAWEYTCNEVEVLCRKCHCNVHGIVE